MSSLVWRMAERPSRTTWWSSAMRTLIFLAKAFVLLVLERDVDGDRGALAWRRVDPHPSPEQPRALRHALEAERGPLLGVLRDLGEVEPPAVIVDRGGQRCLLDVDPDVDPGGAGVLLHVRQRLLDDPEQENLGLGVEILLAAGEGDGRGDPVLLGVGLGVVLERGVEIQAVEVERLEVEHDLPGFLDRALEDVLGLLQCARAAR